MDEAFPLTFMHFCELDDKAVFAQNLGLHMCVFESLPQQLPVEKGGRERVHCTLSQ